MRSFSVVPPLVCPGQSATVQWDVQGRAALHAEPTPTGWTDGEVTSTGSRVVTPQATTAFTVTALDAKLAEGQSSGTKSVQVPHGAEDRGASTTCDAATRKCTGTFALDDGGGAMQVRALSAPRVVRAGAVQPATITARHGSWQALVVDAAPTPVGQPAAGTWTLEVELAQGDAEAPPPQLRVHVDFGCP